ncbi:hypothetical protein ABGB12_27565 [Actinocorallia sp. B10E7]|uniref:hypothetical protein n=1 Tax=Actinocorallia sp. B10E7 TaxID=3153558 RepID=UPI00325CCED8
MSYPPQDPYGYGYGIPGHPNQYGNQYGPFIPPPAPASNGAAVAALVANILLTITCCGLLAVPGIVTAAMAVGRVNTDPVSAKNLTMWSWVIFGAAVLVGIVLLVLFFAMGISGSFEESTTGGDGITV